MKRVNPACLREQILSYGEEIGRALLLGKIVSVAVHDYPNPKGRYVVLGSQPCDIVVRLTYRLSSKPYPYEAIVEMSLDDLLQRLQKNGGGRFLRAIRKCITDVS